MAVVLGIVAVVGAGMAASGSEQATKARADGTPGLARNAADAPR